MAGFTKLLDFPAAIAEQEHFGLHPGWLWAALTIAVELVGSALVISGRLVWLGAGTTFEFRQMRTRLIPTMPAEKAVGTTFAGTLSSTLD